MDIGKCGQSSVLIDDKYVGPAVEHKIFGISAV